MQTELDLQRRIFFEKQPRRTVDKGRHRIGDHDAVHDLVIHLGDRLEVDAVAAQCGIFAFVLREDLLAVILQMAEICRAAVGIPQPRIAPDDPDAAIVRIRHHLRRIDGHAVVPHDQRVHLQLDHIVDHPAPVVDHMSPRPDAALADGGRGHTLKIGQRLIERTDIIVVVVRILPRHHVFIVKIHAPVQRARVVIALDQHNTVLDTEDVSLLLLRDRERKRRQRGIIFPCSDIDANSILKRHPLVMAEALGIGTRGIQQQLTAIAFFCTPVRNSPCMIAIFFMFWSSVEVVFFIIS